MFELKDKIILITGSTDGIGKQTALELAEMGATVIIHGRDPVRTKNVAEEIRESAGNKSVDFIAADLSSLQAVRKLSDEFHEKYNHLDVLINNAGVYMQRREFSTDGFEMTFAVNHLAYFLLAHLMLDLLKKPSHSRIINVASMAHAHEINFDHLQAEEYYDGYTAYAQSKLCNIVFTFCLAEKLKDTGITVNCLHPGVISTKLLRTGWGLGGSPVAAGAKTPVYLASSNEIENITGKYFFNNRSVNAAPVAYNKDIQQKLWHISMKMTGLKI